MAGRRRFKITLVVLAVVLLAAAGLWFTRTTFEGEKPVVKVEGVPQYLAGEQDLTLEVRDDKRGLRRVQVTLVQGGREVDVFQQEFPFEGFLNRQGARQFRHSVSLDPAAMNLAQGEVDLFVRAWDYSRRNGGDGNLTVFQSKMVVDTIPPALRAVSRLHYVNRGGAGMVVYQTSSDAVESGVMVDEYTFYGFPVGEGYHVCYFGVPPDVDTYPEVYLWSRDRAGNRSDARFNHRIRRRRFREERINISERFLKKILPYFSAELKNVTASDIDKFLKINRDLREQNARQLYLLRRNTAAERLWSGPWLRMKNAATMARFGDRRHYYYAGKKIDEQRHLGVDLASLAHSEVQAANHGRVIFTGRLGIYGLSVVIDHGQGVASAYAHLSQILVKPGDEVKKGDLVGITGQTGLAGGDHLHFAVLVGGVPVNPVEWWDPHWIEDNIEKKLALLKP